MALDDGGVGRVSPDEIRDGVSPYDVVKFTDLGAGIPGLPSEIRYLIVTFLGYDNGDSGASITIDWNNGQHQLLNVSEDTVISFTDPPGVGHFTLVITQGGAGFTMAWPASIWWGNGGVAHVLSPLIGTVDICAFQFYGSIYFALGNKDFKAAP